MNRFKKRKLKKKLQENKVKIIIGTIIFFIVTMTAGYAALGGFITIRGHAQIGEDACDVHVTGNFTVNGSWTETENGLLTVDNYETEALDGFTIEMKFPSGTSIGPMGSCYNNTVDDYLVQDANGVISISISPSNECLWMSSIPAGTTENGIVTPGSWANGNGIYFQVHNTAIDGENPIYPEYITFDGCTIYGSGGSQNTPLTALGLSPSSATIGIGEILNLTTTKTPAYKQVELTYTSSDTSVATVSSTGVVTGVGEGTATITVSGDGLSASSTITVEEVVIVPESITVTPSSYRMTVGELVPLQATITPSNASATITWTSSDSSVATVSSSGTVTAIAEGTATITATTDNNLSSTCEIRVVNQMSSNDVEVTFSLNYEYSYGDTYMFTITLENQTSERITYFKLGYDLPTTVTYNLWQANVQVVDGNYFEMIRSDYTYIEPNGTFTIQGSAQFPDNVLEDGLTPWNTPTRIIPDEYLDPVITSIVVE